jgi:hypothetical protein
VIRHSAGSYSGNAGHGGTISRRPAIVNICACPLFSILFSIPFAPVPFSGPLMGGRPRS